MESIYLGHDYIYFNSGNGERVNPIPQDPLVREMLRGKHHSLPVNHLFHDLKLNRAHPELVYIIPNQAYENKTIHNHIYQWLLAQGNRPVIISEIEAIANYLLHQKKENGVYQVVNIDQHSLQIHEVEITNNQFFHLYSQELDWNTPCAIQPMFKNSDEKFFTQRSVVDQIDAMNKIWQEDLLTLEPKYYRYRIDYNSKVTYQELKNTANRLAKDYTRTLNQTSTLKPSGKVHYCGALSTWSGFMEFFDSSYSRINWPAVLKVKHANASHYPILSNALELGVFGVEKQWVKVLNHGYQYAPGLNATQPAAYGLKHVRIPVSSGQNQVLQLRFKCGNHEYDGVLDLSKSQGLASAKIKTNGAYQWTEVDLSVELDGCRNIVLSVFQDSKLLHAAAISKLKKHE